MQDINEFSIRKVITVELITCLCVGFLLSLVAVLFCPSDKEIIGLRKEIFMFIAGLLLWEFLPQWHYILIELIEK